MSVIWERLSLLLRRGNKFDSEAWNDKGYTKIIGRLWMDKEQIRVVTGPCRNDAEMVTELERLVKESGR